MSVQLLDKTRKINRLLHNNNSSKVVFNDICEILNEILASNVLVVSKKGKVLGSGQWKDVEIIHELIDNQVGSHIDEMLNERLLSILSTKENVNLQTLGFSPEVVKGYQAIVTPIDIAGERLGTLFIYKKDELYEIDDIILSEYGTTVVGLEMLRSVNEESAEEIRKEQIVQSAISTLSFSELEAIIHIFDELEGTEGILVASKIADRVGITRSVIVNALRKFESAGVIESRSSGMKGTYIKVVNVQLLDKTRKINRLLHNNNSSKVVFNDICEILNEILASNVLVVSKKGKVLGSGQWKDVEIIHELIDNQVGSHIDEMLNERLLSILSTKENVNLQTLGFSPEVVKGYQAIVTPIDIAGERLGTLFIYKKDELYEIDDIILSEYGTTVVGLEMLRSVNEESAEEIRKEQIVQSAISTLSFSELEAIIHIFDELEGTEGILVASKIADRVGITRSVIVNALRKFESAGVIESRSSGMKGTYIKVVNDYIFEELDAIKKKKMK